MGCFRAVEFVVRGVPRGRRFGAPGRKRRRPRTAIGRRSAAPSRSTRSESCRRARNLFSLLDAAQADLISDRIDTGGLSSGEPARIGAHGSSWTQTRFRVGDANINDPEGTGAPLLLPNLSAWDRVDVSTGLLPVESNAPGLAITLEPRRPAATWTRTLEGLFSGPAMLSRTATTTPPAIAHLNTFGSGNLFASGPLVPGRLGLVIVADWAHSSRFERERPDTPRRERRIDVRASRVHADLERPRADDRVWLQGTRSPLANRVAFGEPSAAERGVAVHVQSRWERQFATGLSGALSASFTSASDSRHATCARPPSRSSA